MSINTTNVNKVSIVRLQGAKVLVVLTTLMLILSACSTDVKTTEASDYNSDLGIQYLQKGLLNRANEKLLKSLEQNPNSAKSNHYYAILQERLGDKEKAGRYFRKAISIAPKNPEIRNNFGSFLCKNNQAQAGVKQFLIAVKDPLYATPEFAYTNAGICLRKSNNNALAETYFRKALKRNNKFASALLEMAQLYADKKSYPRAQGFMLRYETVGRSTPQALELCIAINEKIRNNAKADNCRAALYRLFPASPEAERLK